MSVTPADNLDQQSATRARVVVYVGEDSRTIPAALAPLGTAISFKTEPRVSAALLAVAQNGTDVVIVDLTTNDDARTMLIAALAAGRKPPRIIVLSRREDIQRHLRYPGVYCVIPSPFMPARIRAAVSDRRSARRNNETPQEPPTSNVGEVPLKSPEAEKKHRSWPGWRLYFLASGRFMGLVSNLYKNAAFVLLASLFAAFTFYGLLIGYFLLASNWGAPMTLSRGHQLVEKAVNDLSELRVTLSVNVQRHSEAELEGRKAKAAYDDASVLVDFLKGTVDSEIASRIKQAGLAEKSVSRMEKVKREFEQQSSGVQTTSTPQQLYKKRLITKRSLDTQMIGSLEANQRLSQLDTDLEAERSHADELKSSVDLLQSLKLLLEGSDVGKITAGSAELILLTKEVVDARSNLDQASNQLSSATERGRLLNESAGLLRQRLADIEHGAMGRAIKGRIDVIFVPYGNERGFKPGTPLYSCAMTVLFCHRAGVVGEALPGESNAVHPFFGKPLRGFFVEAKLDDPDAASEEIIHAVRPPFFF